MEKLSKKAELLKNSVSSLLVTYPVVGIDMKQMEMSQGYQRRSAQRTVKELSRCKKFAYLERVGGVQLLARNDFDPILETVKMAGSSGFINFYENRGKNGKNDVSVVSVALYTNNIDLKDTKEPYKYDPKEGDRNDKSDKNDNNAVAVATDPDDPWAIATQDKNEFDELFAMVCSCCNKLPMLVLNDGDHMIERLFKVGVTADEVYRYYHSQSRPNYWAFHWKGMKGAAPSFKDILDTLGDARNWKPSYTQTLPGLMEIYKQFEKFQTATPLRGNETSPLIQLKEMGFGPLFDEIGMGWYDLCRNYTNKNRQLIKDAYWKLREKEKVNRMEPRG